MPELEHEQLPEAQRVIACAADMFLDQAGDERRLEIAPLPRSRCIEHVGEEIGQSPAEPDAHRHAEALLPAVENSRGQQRPQRLFQNVLAAAACDLEADGSVAAKSMTSLSSSGTRDSIECAMLIRSTFVRTSSGRYVSKSSRIMRLRSGRASNRSKRRARAASASMASRARTSAE